MIDDLCVNRVDVTSFTPSQDIEGGYVNGSEVVDHAYLMARITPTTSGKRYGFGQQFSDMTHVVHIPGAYYLTPQNKIYMRVYYRENVNVLAPYGAKDRVFEVLGSRVPDELGEFTIVAAREYNAGEQS